jgi:chromosome segregation ATPase
LEKQLQLSNDQLAVLNGRLDGEGHPNVMEQQITALQEECNMLKSEAEKNTLENNKALYEYETMISQLELLHSEKINLLETQLKDSDKRYRKDMDRKRSKWSDETNSLIKKHDESIGKLEGEIQSLQESVKEYELKLADAKKEVTDAEGESYSLKMRCQELEKEVSFYRSKSDHSTALQLELDKIRIAAIRLEEENKELRVVTTRESAHSPTSAELSKRDDVIKKLMDDLQVLQGEKANHVWDRMEGMTSAQDSFFTNESLIGTLENKYKNIIAELKARLADRDVSISAMVQASVTQEMTLTALKNELNTLKSEQNERSAAKDFDPHASTASTVSTDTLSEYSRKIQEKDSTITSLVKSSMNQEHQIKLLRDEMDELRSKSDSSTRSSVWVSFEQIQHESEIFAGQIIEQDEEIDDLRFQLEEHRSNAASLMSEVANLKNKLKKMESERNTAALTEEMMSLEKINSDLRDEIRELRKRLRSAQNDIDKVAELE